MRRPVHVIGVPLDLGAGRRGVDMGPSAIRIAGLDAQIRALGWAVVDEGDITTPIQETNDPGDATKKYIREIGAVCDALYARSLSVLERGGLPLVLGGDHSLGAGSVAASAAFARGQGKPLGLIWVDAHGDMNTPSSSESGNVHGMPLAALLGREPAELSQLGGFAPKVTPERVVLIGIRNLDDHEKQIVRAAGVHVFTIKDIDRNGIAAVMEQAIAIATRGTAGVHVSFDLDVCDPTIAPGVGTPVKGGLDYREAHMVMEMLADSEQLLALDMVEVNPVLDVANTTATLATELVLSALGKEII
ncbi:MAG: arginase [Acidobacteria bacterium]|jgi:arginase|nr:arginase [Acidobacteriota bacterium]